VAFKQSGEIECGPNPTNVQVDRRLNNADLCVTL